MQFIVEPITLQLKTPFRIAHGVSTARHNVLVQLGEGLGEAALMPYAGHSQAEIVAWLQAVDAAAVLGETPLALEDALDRLPDGPAPARAALDMALHDHWAKELGQPLYRLLGLNPARAPCSSITLSIPETLAELPEQVSRWQGWPILKLKLGTGQPELDEAIVATVRAATSAQLCVDANSAWSVAEAADLIPRLAAYDLLFIEQPIRAADPADWARLRRRLPESDLPPLFADESVQQAGDILALTGLVDGVNLKLAKTGGLRQARRMIGLARTVGLRVMLGCAVESAVGLTAAAHLAPLVDFADLDGNLEVVNDPYVGVRLIQGRLHLPEGPGLGVVQGVAVAGQLAVTKPTT